MGLGSYLHSFKIPMAGKKLTPMLAISAQGLFYYIRIALIGINFAGLFFAVIMASLWAFIQPVLFIFLILGKTSVDVGLYFLNEFEKLIPHADKLLIWIIAGVIFLKCLTTYALSLFAIKMSDLQFENYQNKMLLNIKTKAREKNKPLLILIAQDSLLGPH